MRFGGTRGGEDVFVLIVHHGRKRANGAVAAVSIVKQFVFIRALKLTDFCTKAERYDKNEQAQKPTQ